MGLQLAGRERNPRNNRRLGLLLAFVAGAVNAGGFLAVHRYTSHVTGLVSAIADDLVLGELALALAGILLVAVFMGGAMTTAVMVNWARRRQLHSEFALGLLLESVLLLLFGLLGAYLATSTRLLVPATVVLLCFIMGLQNAIVTKVSRAEIRTTHMTGIVTDIGIELGKMLYLNGRTAREDPGYVRANADRLRLHAAILGCFVVGGVVGAVAFKSLSYLATVPLAIVLAAVAAGPVWRDLAGPRS